MIFDKYSRYYDLLYRDKDYAAEAAFVARLLGEHAPGAKSVLELGCGTGLHAQHLAAAGYTVHGVDRSDEMLKRAQARQASLEPALAGRLGFSNGDVRSVRLSRQFECVVSLFHVVSYQTANADLRAAFATAREHVAPGGVFVFDCWYGPAVLKERPSVRLKRMEDEVIHVTRIAQPVLHPNECVVEVDYTVFIQARAGGTLEELHETHRMRYLFMPEVELLAGEAGFSIARACEWMTGRAPGEDTWSVCFVARA